jgi:hypothetical protein
LVAGIARQAFARAPGLATSLQRVCQMVLHTGRVHRAIHKRYSTQSSGIVVGQFGWDGPSGQHALAPADQLTRPFGQQLIGQRPEPAWEHFLSQRMRRNLCVRTSVRFANALAALDPKQRPTTTNFMGDLPPTHCPACATSHPSSKDLGRDAFQASKKTSAAMPPGRCKLHNPNADTRNGAGTPSQH